MPIVRGYIGKGSSNVDPINTSFSSAVTHISEGVRETMQEMDGWNSDVPSMIARTVVYDVTNHAPRELIDVLDTGL